MAEMNLEVQRGRQQLEAGIRFWRCKNAEETGELVESGAAEALGPAPKCGAGVREHGANYVRKVGAHRRP